jgi:hypothetical protein
MKGVGDKLEALRAQLSKTGKEIANLVRALEHGTPPASVLARLHEREQERASIELEITRLKELKEVPEISLQRIDRLIGESVDGLGEMLRGDVATAGAHYGRSSTAASSFIPRR